MKEKQIYFLALFFLLLFCPVMASTPFQTNSSNLIGPGDGFSERITEAGFNPQVLIKGSYSIVIPESASAAEKVAVAEKAVSDPNFPPITIAIYSSSSGKAYGRRSFASRGRTLAYLDIAPIIKKHAGYYRLDPHLVKAVIKAESGFWNYAVSPSGASGLMQLMPTTARLLGCSNSFDPEQNIKAGCKYLRELLNMFGDVRLAVAAYNAGPGTVRRAGGIPNNWQTPGYVRKVFNYYHR